MIVMVVCTWAQDEGPADLYMAQPNKCASEYDKTGHIPLSDRRAAGIGIGLEVTFDDEARVIHTLGAWKNSNRERTGVIRWQLQTTVQRTVLPQYKGGRQDARLEPKYIQRRIVNTTSCSRSKVIITRTVRYGGHDAKQSQLCITRIIASCRLSSRIRSISSQVYKYA
jgi:hypothetical protein